jgi:O-antigen ligase
MASNYPLDVDTGLSRTDTRYLSPAIQLTNLAENVLAVGEISLLAGAHAIISWAAKSNGWIFFFLVAKPLFDLTWRWRFFRLSEQGVNIQTFVGLAALGLNWAVLWRRRAWRTFPSRVLIFLGFAVLSVALSPSTWGFNELLRLLSGTAFFYTVGPLLADYKQFDRFAKAMLVVCAVPVGLSFLQIAGILPYNYWDWIDDGPVGRATGTYDMPLSLIYLFVYTIPLALYIATNRRQTRRTRQLAWVSVLGSAISLAFTYHRMGYAAIALGVAAWLYLNKGGKAVLVLAVILLVAALTSLQFLQQLYEPVATSLAGGTDISSGQFLRGRGVQWFLYMDSYISARPIQWMFGLGGSVIKGLEDEDDPSDLSPDEPPGVLSPNEPHNDFIRILHAYGAVGLILYLSILALFFRRALQLRDSEQEIERALAGVVLASLLAIVLLSITAEPMRYPTAIWYLFALGSAMFCVRTSKHLPFQQGGVHELCAAQKR